MVKKKIKIPIYNRDLELVISENLCGDSKGYIENRYSFTIGDDAYGYTMSREGVGCAIVLIADKYRNIQNQTIAHESFHVAADIIDNLGDVFKPGVNDEQYAYLIGYIAKETTALINRHKFNII